MKKLLTIIFSLTISLCFSQTKEQLIDSIIKFNRVESDCIGIGCMVSSQYKRFQKLKEKISDKEIIELSKHENPTIRTYASIELIQSEKGNIPELLSTELQKNEVVKTFEGCIIDIEPISSVIYHEYWNMIRIDASRKTKSNNYEQDLAMKKRLAADLTMERLDNIIIHSDKKVYWLLYSRTFENRKHKESYLPRIEELAFKKNNFFAFEYLIRHYPNKYDERIKYYFNSIFPSADFDKNESHSSLHSFIEYLLETKELNSNEIAFTRLKNENCWMRHEGWYKRIIKKYKVKSE